MCDDVSIRCVLDDVTMETSLDSYRVLLASTRAIVDLEAEVSRLAAGDAILLEEDDVFDENDSKLCKYHLVFIYRKIGRNLILTQVYKLI